MMNDTTMSLWRSFYREVTGHNSFAWQDRMVNHILETGCWPHTLSMPTGAGKTSVLYMHAFVNAMAQRGDAPADLPRRLFYVVNRRSLVDNSALLSAELAQLLSEPTPDSAAEIVAALLSERSGSAGSALQTHTLRGGMKLSYDWREAPTAVSIISATPDMWGSRALFGGYRTSAAARPQEAALAVLDAVVVIDEAHLQQQLTATARRIAELTAGNHPLHVVASTATQVETSGVGVITPTDEDLADPTLLSRITAARTISLHHHDQEVRSNRADPVLVEITNTEVESRTNDDDPPVLVVCNTVSRAVNTYTELIKTHDPEQVLLLTGPMRPHDTKALLEKHQDLFSSNHTRSNNPHHIKVLVATQTVEVGVDLDAWSLVTELAPATALAQRAGRINRRGLRDHGRVHVISSQSALTSPVYSTNDLLTARDWITTIADGDISGRALLHHPVPASPAARLVIDRLERADLAMLTQTSPGALVTAPDLDIWLDDDLSNDQPRASLVVAADLPTSIPDAMALLRAEATTHPDEVMNTAAYTLSAVITAVIGKDKNPNPIFRLRRRGENYHVESVALVNTGKKNPTAQIQHGDVIVVTDTMKVAVAGVPCDHPNRDTIPAAPVPRWRLHRDNSTSDLRRALCTLNGCTQTLTDDDIDSDDLRDTAATLAEQAGFTDLATALRDSDRPSRQFCQHDGDTPDPRWISITIDTTPIEEEISLATPKRKPVLLADHSRDVADEAARLGAELGVDDKLITTLWVAGLYHDAGKADPRFQTYRLKNTNTSVPLAKSRLSPTRLARLAQHGVSLPLGWRHELKSVLHLYANAAAGSITDQHGAPLTLDQPQLEFVARLVGTSHGHGRGGLPAGSAPHLLCDPADPVELHDASAQLFTTGYWHTLISATEQESRSPWHTAQLEAILRIADHHVSARGH